MTSPSSSPTLRRHTTPLPLNRRRTGQKMRIVAAGIIVATPPPTSNVTRFRGDMRTNSVGSPMIADRRRRDLDLERAGQSSRWHCCSLAGFVTSPSPCSAAAARQCASGTVAIVNAVIFCSQRTCRFWTPRPQDTEHYKHSNNSSSSKMVILCNKSYLYLIRFVKLNGWICLHGVLD